MFGSTISTYTDAEALDDGARVDVSGWGLGVNSQPLTRIARCVWGALSETFDLSDPAGVGAARREVAERCRAARLDEAGDGYLLVSDSLWFVDNGEGYTLMLPSDY
jgi:hypothetical protein